MKISMELEDRIINILRNAHTSLRTFREVPEEEQAWTSFDEDVIHEIEEVLNALEI